MDRRGGRANGANGEGAQRHTLGQPTSHTCATRRRSAVRTAPFATDADLPTGRDGVRVRARATSRL
jgi:hypothetical protein